MTLHEEYLLQAAYCDEMAAKSASPENRTGWLYLAERWRAMIPQRARGMRLREAEKKCENLANVA